MYPLRTSKPRKILALCHINDDLLHPRNYFLKNISEKYQTTDITVVDKRGLYTNQRNFIKADLTYPETWDIIKVHGPYDVAIDMMCNGFSVHQFIAMYLHTVMKNNGLLYWVSGEKHGFWPDMPIKNAKLVKHKRFEYSKNVKFPFLIYQFNLPTDDDDDDSKKRKRRKLNSRVVYSFLHE